MPPMMAPGAMGPMGGGPPSLAGIVQQAMGGLNTQPDDDDEDTEQEDEGQVFEDPRTTSLDKTVFFIEKALLPKGAEVGDEIYLCAKIKSMGDKVGIVPVDVYPEDAVTVKGDGTKPKKESEEESEPDAEAEPEEPNDDH